METNYQYNFSVERKGTSISITVSDNSHRQDLTIDNVSIGVVINFVDLAMQELKHRLVDDIQNSAKGGLLE